MMNNSQEEVRYLNQAQSHNNLNNSSSKNISTLNINYSYKTPLSSLGNGSNNNYGKKITPYKVRAFPYAESPYLKMGTFSHVGTSKISSSLQAPFGNQKDYSEMGKDQQQVLFQLK